MLKTLLISVILLLCTACMEGDDGKDGSAGLNGPSFTSKPFRVSVQEIVGDGVRERFEASELQYIELPRIAQLNVDNVHPDCELQATTLILETDNEIVEYIFEPTSNRYQMNLKEISHNVGRVLDTSTLLVYFKESPITVCGGVEYRLHAGVAFEMIKLEEVRW